VRGLVAEKTMRLKRLARFSRRICDSVSRYRDTERWIERTVTAAAIALLAAFAVTAARATAEYDYKKNERLVIDGGLAPNKRLAIRAGRAGDSFGFFLTSEPSHRVAARLSGIAPDDLLDTAPEALHAIWAPDSAHVVVMFRSSRHELTWHLYGFDGHGARLVAGPDTLDEVIKGKQVAIDDYSSRLRTIELTWQGPQRFHVSQRWLFDAPDRKLAQALASYGRESPNNNYKETGADGKPKWTFVAIAIEADCELGPGNSFRVIAMQPGALDGWWE